MVHKKVNQESQLMTKVSNPSVVTVLPDPRDQSSKQTFITYQNTIGLGAILCQTFPPCGYPLKLTLRCNVEAIAISSVAVTPRLDDNLPSHFILFSATNGTSMVFLNLLICWISDCTRKTEVRINQSMAEGFASSTSITLTKCDDDTTLACALLTYTSRISDESDIPTIINVINVVHCMNPGCTDFETFPRVVELGDHDNSPGLTFIGLTGQMLPVISYFSSLESANLTKGLKLSRCSTIDCGSDNELTTIVISNSTGVNYGMGTAVYKEGWRSGHQIIMVYTSEDNTKLYSKSCLSDKCESTPMSFSEHLIWKTLGENTTITKPSVAIDYTGWPMITFFQVTKNSSGIFNSIGIARCVSVECQNPIATIVVSLNETSVQSSWLAPQFLFYDPAVVYTRTNHSLEYIRCQDYICAKRAMHVCLDDAHQFVDIIVPRINLQSYIISSILIFQLCVAFFWLSVRGSKRADFISRYVTTPFLSVVLLTAKTRSWLRFIVFCSAFCAILCIVPWFIFAVGPIFKRQDLVIPPLIPAALGLLTWLLLRKARAGKLATTKTVILGMLWMVTTFAELWSLNRIIRMKLTSCSTVNIVGLKSFNIIGGVGEILLAFMSIFLLNSIRLALKNTSPECAKLLDSGGTSRRRWNAPRVNQHWVKTVTPRHLENGSTPQRFEQQEHTRRMMARHGPGFISPH